MAIGGSKIFVTGGSMDSDHSIPSLEVLMYDANDISRGYFHVRNMNHQRENHACTILQSHLLLVAGGDWDAQTTAEILNFQESQYSRWKWIESTY